MSLVTNENSVTFTPSKTALTCRHVACDPLGVWHWLLGLLTLSVCVVREKGAALWSIFSIFSMCPCKLLTLDNTARYLYWCAVVHHNVMIWCDVHIRIGVCCMPLDPFMQLLLHCDSCLIHSLSHPWSVYTLSLSLSLSLPGTPCPSLLLSFLSYSSPSYFALSNL